ncbi:MAG: hypothetical protein NTY74_14490 [Ignavibacteriae bacterium]|nr:hypothetical protein [Ignavibacteriota bacterium]
MRFVSHNIGDTVYFEKNQKLSISSFENLNPTEPDRLFSSLFLYNAKKEFESQNKINKEYKGRFEQRVEDLGHFDNCLYYEILAYLNDSSKTLQLDYFKKSYDLGNRDSVFLKNYSLCLYGITHNIYMNMNDNNYEDNNTVNEQSNDFLENYCYKDSILDDVKYMAAYSLYNIYCIMRFDEKGFEINMKNYLTDENGEVPKGKNYCRTILMLGNTYRQISIFSKAKSYYDLIDESCNDKIQSLARKFLEEIKNKSEVGN